MIAVFLIIYLLLGGALVALYFLKQRADKGLALARQQTEAAQKQCDESIARAQGEAQAAIARLQAAYDQKIAELNAESERIREHYETETRKIGDEAGRRLAELEPLRVYAGLKDAEAEVRKSLADALEAASALRQEAEALLNRTHEAASAERVQAQQRAKAIREQAEALLTQATRDAGRIMAEAEKKAEEIGGDAYIALRDKQTLEQAVQALWNVTEGYGDRYVVPTHSLLDDLAIDFGYTEAGQALKAAREQSRRMVEEKQASSCNYEEEDRRDRANRFVVDAFNGRVDAILSRAKHDNYGTLKQEIRDAFNLVNLNGLAFRDARILPAYLECRLAELKWAVAVNELARKQREEQRYLKERLRDEQKAEEERLKRLREAEKEKELIRVAMEEAEKRFAQASAQQKAESEKELQEWRQKFADATTRELTIAQQTKKGYVYIISNIGSFGEGVYKVGLTRRLPQERIDELSGASVPFEFDIHAEIQSDNAPALEHKLHKQLMERQVNKMNYRKEFFRINLEELRKIIDTLKEQGEELSYPTWTELALATEYKESLRIENDPQEKEKWLARQRAKVDRQLTMDLLQTSGPSNGETDEDSEEA